MRCVVRFVFVGAMVLGASSLLGDDLSGTNTLLCSSSYASACYADGECESGPPWNLNIPAFIEIDLARKQMSTTRASGENRMTPIKNLERSEGKIILQGVERGRAFSLEIDEETGALSAAVAKDGQGVVVFGNCTPIDATGRSAN